MQLGERVGKVLFYPLVTLSGTPVTLVALFVAIAIFAASQMGAKLAGRAVREGVRRRGHPDGVAVAVAQITRYALVFLGVLIAINTIGININTLLAGSAVLLVGVGLGLQNIIANVVSGLIVLIERPVKKGDAIQIGDFQGTVESIGLRATRIVTRDEVTLVLPNSELTSTRIVNLSSPTQKLRIHVRVGVAYDSDPELVREALLEVARAHEGVLDAPPPEVRLEQFGDSSLDFVLLCWIPDAPSDDEVASELRLGILQAFRERGIGIPFPQRELLVRTVEPLRPSQLPRAPVSRAPLA